MVEQTTTPGKFPADDFICDTVYCSDITTNGGLTDELQKQIQDVIIAVLPKNGQPLFIGVAGSRAKHMNSPGSDFDCKVIVKYPRS